MAAVVMEGMYATNTTVAAKKDAETGEWTDARICQDSRRPNEKCVRDQRVMHRVDELLQKAATCRYFTAIDLEGCNGLSCTVVFV